MKKPPLTTTITQSTFTYDVHIFAVCVADNANELKVVHKLVAAVQVPNYH